MVNCDTDVHALIFRRIQQRILRKLAWGSLQFLEMLVYLGKSVQTLWPGCSHIKQQRISSASWSFTILSNLVYTI